MTDDGQYKLEISKIPEGHIVVGYIANLKVIDAEGNEYWATRMDGLNDMEAFGMMTSAVNDAADDLRGYRRSPE